MAKGLLIFAVKKQKFITTMGIAKENVSVQIFVDSLIWLLGTSCLDQAEWRCSNPQYYSHATLRDENMLPVSRAYHQKHNLSFQNKGYSF